jgi:hypothetical protein
MLHLRAEMLHDFSVIPKNIKIHKKQPGTYFEQKSVSKGKFILS